MQNNLAKFSIDKVMSPKESKSPSMRGGNLDVNSLATDKKKIVDFNKEFLQLSQKEPKHI